MSFSVVKTLRVITLLSILLQLINCERLKCGKDNPSKESHCTKYGTDSGFLCCWISSSKESDSGKCGLMSYGEAKDLGIKGETIIKAEPMETKPPTKVCLMERDMRTSSLEKGSSHSEISKVRIK